MNLNVLLAIFRRNFVSYFSSPTGYVFLCVFVFLSGTAAFWPNDFFNANLANLDQLNKYLPYIMLVFIPAITMSVWAEERRLGTDELLLTIPAGDFEVVLGKYLAAVAIFSASLAFSAICNFSVLAWLGTPDFGLFMGMYFGYWMVGLAMLAIGMVASFLTANLTVGFLLGAAFNAPLVFASSADAILPGGLATAVRRWSIAGQFEDFGRGVISLSSVAYFSLIVVVMLYLCMVLIGRRHWSGGRDGRGLLGHFVVRTLALLVIAVCATTVLLYVGMRPDVTSEGLNRLSPQSKKLIGELKPHQPVVIEAFLSPASEMPESYVRTRSDLVRKLYEIEKLGGNKIKLTVHQNTEPFSEEAVRAEEQFDITPREVVARSQGALQMENLYMGVAFTSGLQKLVIPFFDRGLPVEYELVRSITSVGLKEDEELKRLGLLQTDAGLNGRFDLASMQRIPRQRLVEELEKQYEIVDVDANSPITERYDVLLAVQPSSLSLQQMPNFIDAVRSGQPTVIFEDPMPVFMRVVGTSAPKPPMGGGPFGMGGQPQPKGNIEPLWDLLGIQFHGEEIVWQDYNPHPKMQHFPKEFVFITEGCGAEDPFNPKNVLSSKLQEVLFPFPGYVRRVRVPGLEYEPLVYTGSKTSGTISYSDVSANLNSNADRERKYKQTDIEHVLAVHITGELKPDAAMHPGHDGEHDDATGDGGDTEINVAVVADIDCLSSQFFDLRAAGEDPNLEVYFNFDNVPFVLNMVDVLAGDERFVDIRKRRPRHRTLTLLETKIYDATQRANREKEKYREKIQEAKEKEEQKIADEIQKLQAEFDKGNIDPGEAIRRVRIKEVAANKRLAAIVEQREREAEREIGKIELELKNDIRDLQFWYKAWAVVAPPLFPLLIGIAVFFNRRAREKEGVAKTRLR